MPLPLLALPFPLPLPFPAFPFPRPLPFPALPSPFPALPLPFWFPAVGVACGLDAGFVAGPPPAWVVPGRGDGWPVVVVRLGVFPGGGE